MICYWLGYLLKEGFVNLVDVKEQARHVLALPFRADCYFSSWVMSRWVECHPTSMIVKTTPPNTSWTNGLYKCVLGFSRIKLNCTMSIEILWLHNGNCGLLVHNDGKFKSSLILSWTFPSFVFEGFVANNKCIKLCFSFLFESKCFQVLPMWILEVWQCFTFCSCVN